MTDTLTDRLVAAVDALGVGATPAAADDAVLGVRPALVARPESTEQTAALMRVAAEHGARVVPRGSGSRLHWGDAPEAVDIVVDLSRQSDVIEHAAGDLVVQAQAGLPLERLQERLAEARQQLALDPYLPHTGGVADGGPGSAGTLGGLVSTSAAGPLRLSHGAVRDLLIGVTLVRADGVVAKAGGKVVKNVAGYDLGKLVAGSFGTLAIITETVFRLHPLPQTTCWITVPATGPDGIHDRVQRLIHSQTVPTAIELDLPSAARSAGSGPSGDGRLGGGVAGSLSVLMAGIPAGVEARATAARQLLGPDAEVTDTAPAWWQRLPWRPGDLGLRMTSEIAGIGRLVQSLDRVGAEHGVSPALRGSPAVGVLHAAVPGEELADLPPTAVASLLADLRKAATAFGGQVVMLQSPPQLVGELDVWGHVQGLDLMRAIKHRFDPERLLSPGRFVGGI
ncbi:MAG: FAD-binding oxidoreductase [Actinomycetes bacterium]